MTLFLTVGRFFAGAGFGFEAAVVFFVAEAVLFFFAAGFFVAVSPLLVVVFLVVFFTIGVSSVFFFFGMVAGRYNIEYITLQRLLKIKKIVISSRRSECLFFLPVTRLSALAVTGRLFPDWRVCLES
ncbi:MAG: hypothetical protein OQK66_09130 [Prosthecochloris sp.]|uniref:hypothetical protein n=1 Tax=unclassified Prosthecochloris TaxID=2632826 RepID=UPI001FC95A88|nr:MULTISPECIES: hypothetical protein [unclassified Prosthecochloris]MCW8799114.1 hypothetical protein [Prosthecochloris sp.]